MTLRDYFAGQALMGILATSKTIEDASGPLKTLSPEAIALMAFSYADAMLAERNKDESQ